MIVGEKDTHCSPDHARRIQSEIGGAVKSLDLIPGFTHGSFEGHTDKSYVDVVLKALAANDHAAEAYLQ